MSDTISCEESYLATDTCTSLTNHGLECGELSFFVTAALLDRKKHHDWQLVRQAATFDFRADEIDGSIRSHASDFPMVVTVVSALTVSDISVNNLRRAVSAPGIWTPADLSCNTYVLIDPNGVTACADAMTRRDRIRLTASRPRSLPGKCARATESGARTRTERQGQNEHPSGCQRESRIPSGWRAEPN